MNISGSLLSNRQRDELHRAILSYLSNANLQSSYAALREELDGLDSPDRFLPKATNGDDDQRYKGLLEKKWTSVIRLQKKIMDLEARLHALQTELDSAPSSMRQKSLDPVTWLPRSPARHNLTGHRMPVSGLAFHPTFTVVASSSEDATIKIWDWETGEFEQTIKGHTKAVHDVDFSFDGKLLISCSSDLTLKLWDSTNAYSTLKTLHGHDHTISSVRFVPPRGDLAVSCSRDTSLKVWDVVSGYCVRTISNAHTDWIRTVSPSDDGAWYLSAGNDQVARIWDAQSRNTEYKYELRGHEHVIECAMFAPVSAYPLLSDMAQTPKLKTSVEPGKFVATGSRDKTIRLWSAQGGESFKVLSGHDNWVRALVFHPGGKYLLSAADDKTIRCWDLEQQGRCVKTIDEAHSHFVTCLRWAPSISQVLGSSETNGTSKNDKQVVKATGIRCVVASGGVDLEVRIWMP